jgi:hypothetical protein
VIATGGVCHFFGVSRYDGGVGCGLGMWPVYGRALVACCRRAESMGLQNVDAWLGLAGG